MGAETDRTDKLIPLPVLAKMKELVLFFSSLRKGKLTGPNQAWFQSEFGKKKLYYEFADPDYSKQPDVVAASYRGLRIYFLRWDLFFPGFEPMCKCGSALNGKRWSCSAASGFAKPILFSGGGRAYVVSWFLECPREWDEACKTGKQRLTFGSADPHILLQVEHNLGRHVRAMFPVAIPYANPKAVVLLSSSLTRACENTVVTYEPFDVQARKIKVNTRELYDEHAADYDSSCVKWNSALSALKQPPVGFEEFPRFEEWVGRESVDGETFLKYLTRAWYESGRNRERNIELQQVRVNNAPSSSDHTFATIKNIHQPTTQGQGDRLKMVWDMVKNTTGEVVTAACVSTTAVGA